jgi:hypothetical protein
MPTTAPVPEKKSFPITPSGTHVARVYRFMNLGTRIQEYMGVPKDYPDTLVTFTLELPNELNEFTVKNEDGSEEKVSKPFVISKEFTLSMGAKSNLRPFVEGIIGVKLTDEEARVFDIETLVGMPCLATITHTKGKKDPSKTYANLTSVSPLVKGMTAPDPINQPVIQDVKTMELEDIDKLPEFLQVKMKDSDEYKRRVGTIITPNTGGKKEEPDYPEITDDDIPF